MMETNFQKKWGGAKFGRKRAKVKKEVFCHFVDYKSWDFAEFAYKREQRYLAGGSGQSPI